MKATPAIPLFGDAYLADTRHLSLEEHGAYLQLLMIAWRIDGCCLPDDDTRLARMLGVPAAKWRKLKPVVMAFWELDGDQWKQRRLTKERNYVEGRRQSQRDKAIAKWGGETAKDDDLTPARKRAARLAEARAKGRHTDDEWSQLLEITGRQCVKCRATGCELVKDHILPIYRGGSDALSNLQPLCISCNSSKSADDTDYRLSVCKDLFERLPNACRSPAPPPPPPQEGVKGDATHHSPQPIQEAVDFYNENAVQADWPTIRLLTDGRRAALRSRLKREGIEGWKAAIIRARASPFLARDPPPNFFTFDWLVKASNFVKVIEGNYDRQSAAQPVNRGIRPSPGMALLREASADEAAERSAQAGDCGAWPALSAER